MKYVCSIDPGRTATGWALFRDSRLVACGKDSAETLLDGHKLRTIVPSYSVVVIERPIIYPNGKKNDKPDNDILQLGILAGEYRGYCRMLQCSTEYVLPKSWKGTIGKPKNKNETYIIEERVLKVLDEAERKLVYSTKSTRAKKLDHNTIDGIGIGLWAVGRKYRGEVL
jgi:hypothetical protein